MWHHFPTTPPPEATPLNLRRFPENTDPVSGTWSAADQSFTLARQGWVLHWALVVAWSPQAYASNALPKPTEAPPDPRWHDIYSQPPPDNLSCYIRRWHPGQPTLRAVWNPNADLNFVAYDTLSLPWYCVSAWKPAT